jgi:prevent-host-death family protein
MKIFSITEAEAKLPKLMKMVEAGEQVLITREGEIVAEFIGVRPSASIAKTVRRVPELLKNASPRVLD